MCNDFKINKILVRVEILNDFLLNIKILLVWKVNYWFCYLKVSRYKEKLNKNIKVK